MNRCDWCQGDVLYEKYHDESWGVAVKDDQILFEFLTLEGAQAGLSWLTILKRKENYRNAFDDYDLDKIILYDDEKIESLMQDAGIVRNRLKVKSVVKNAIAVQAIQKEFGSFSTYLWAYVDNEPLQNSFKTLEEVPVETALSKRLSKDLKKRGCSFVGPKIIYAYMQAVGMVNDHLTSCFRYGKV